MSKNIQLPLLQDPAGEMITVLLLQVTPIEHLDCQEPDSELIQSIAQYWVPPILVCPDNRYPSGIYYPIDGKRRIKAVAYLANIGYEFNGVPVEKMPIQAILRKDLLPQDEASYRLAFQANNLRSPNALTDVNAIKSTAKSLGVDVFSKEGRSAVAKALRSNPATIARLAKGIMVDDVVLEAYQQDKISRETFMAIADMRDLEAKDQIAKRITAGEELTKKDVLAYNKQSRQIELVHANEDKPVLEAQTSEQNPLVEAIKRIETALDAGVELDTDDMKLVLVLLKSLL